MEFYGVKYRVYRQSRRSDTTRRRRFRGSINSEINSHHNSSSTWKVAPSSTRPVTFCFSSREASGRC